MTRLRLFLTLLTGVLLTFPHASKGEYLRKLKYAGMRNPNQLGITLETGWNTIAGIGPVLHFYPIPRLALDAGGGFSTLMFKGGVRARYLFMPQKKWAPFAGLGYIKATGSWGATQEYEDDSGTIEYKTEPASFINLCGGIDYRAHSGFMLLFTLGYTYMLEGKNVTITSGTPVSEQKEFLEASYEGGIAVSVGVGFTF